MATVYLLNKKYDGHCLFDLILLTNNAVIVLKLITNLL